VTEDEPARGAFSPTVMHRDCQKEFECACCLLFFNRSGLIAFQEKRNQNVQQENEKAAEEEADNTGAKAGKGRSCSFASAIDGASRPHNAAESITPAAKPKIIVCATSLTLLPKKKTTPEPSDVIRKMKDKPKKVAKDGSMQDWKAIELSIDPAMCRLEMIAMAQKDAIGERNIICNRDNC
jgi:hypothetical protein